MSDRLKYERFIWFHEQVKRGKYPNARQLAEKFEVHNRTAQRDVEFIRDRLHAPIEFDYAHRGYWYSDNSYELPGPCINEDSVLALGLAVRLASTIPDPTFKVELSRLINKAVNISFKTGDFCANKLTDKISVKNIEYAKVDDRVFRMTVLALFEDHSLKITYYSPHNSQTSNRSVQPLHLMHYMGSWHLIAWCSAKKEIRYFALSRISKIAQSTEKITLPLDLPPVKEFTRRHFGIMTGDTTIDVVLRFSPKIAPWVKEQVWHSEQKMSTSSDDGLILEFPVADFRELTKVILSYGADIQVVSPPLLIELIREEIRKMTKIYLQV
jgi:predicted DNA-binding transcriptional regulator YafY